MKKTSWGVLSLLGSTSTLICCVLPALIATIAGGSAVGAMLTLFPWLIPLSQYKVWIFGGSGTLIILTGLLIRNSDAKTTCEITPHSGSKTPCDTTSTWARWLFRISVVIYLIGAFFAFALVPLLRLINGN